MQSTPLGFKIVGYDLNGGRYVCPDNIALGIDEMWMLLHDMGELRALHDGRYQLKREKQFLFGDTVKDLFELAIAVRVVP